MFIIYLNIDIFVTILIIKCFQFDHNKKKIFLTDAEKFTETHSGL